MTTPKITYLLQIYEKYAKLWKDLFQMVCFKSVFFLCNSRPVLITSTLCLCVCNKFWIQETRSCDSSTVPCVNHGYTPFHIWIYNEHFYLRSGKWKTVLGPVFNPQQTLRLPEAINHSFFTNVLFYWQQLLNQWFSEKNLCINYPWTILTILQLYLKRFHLDKFFGCFRFKLTSLLKIEIYSLKEFATVDIQSGQAYLSSY